MYCSKYLQKSMTSLEECRIPVVAGIHGYCMGKFWRYRIVNINLGAGIDLISCSDIRYCEEGVKFTIKVKMNSIKLY